jgi:hypothetical protein
VDTPEALQRLRRLLLPSKAPASRSGCARIQPEGVGRIGRIGDQSCALRNGLPLGTSRWRSGSIDANPRPMLPVRMVPWVLDAMDELLSRSRPDKPATALFQPAFDVVGVSEAGKPA